MKSYVMKIIARIILAIGIASSIVIWWTFQNIINFTYLIIIIITIISSTFLLFAIILSLATILEKQELEEEYITKTLTLITEKLEQTK